VWAADLVPVHDRAGGVLYHPDGVARYWECHRVTCVKSDLAKAMVLANILRTDADAHRPLPTD
jgi:hypothetical protein